MNEDMVPRPGLWYEEARKRWRVKLCKEGQQIERSYHKNYSEALIVWKAAKKRMASTKAKVPLKEASAINRFLYAVPVPPGSSRC